MKSEIKILMALGASLGLAGTALAAKSDYHSQSADPCAVCHSLASAKGWIDDSTPAGSNWLGRTGPTKCYLCHSGTAAYGAVDQTLTVFGNSAASGVHMYSVAIQPRNLDGTAMIPPTGYYVRNVTGVPAEQNVIDCISCHDVHSRTQRPYLTQSVAAGTIEQLCKDCHGRTWSGTKAAGNVGSGNRTVNTRSTHPQGVAYTFTGNNGEAFPTAVQYQQLGGGAVLTRSFGETHPADADFATYWNLGGHRLPAAADGAAVPTAGNIDCQTCHAVHGGENYEPDGGTGARQPEVSLLVAPIVGRTAAGTEGDVKAVVCQACHRGGDAGETVQPATPAFGTSAKDHPIGVRTLLYLPVDRQEAAADADDSSNEGQSTGWTRYWGNDGTNDDVPLCVTCHDLHGGLANSALYRVSDGLASDAPAMTGAVQTVDTFCYTCHGNGAPAAHHSHDANYTASQIVCEDCHGLPGTAGYQAHGDFFTTFAVTAADKTVNLPGGGTYVATVAMQRTNQNSALCVECHVPGDPTTFGGFTTVRGTTLADTAQGAVGTMPARHGVLNRGTASHQVLRTDNNSTGQSGARYAAGGQPDAGIMPVISFLNEAGDATYTYPRTGLTVGAYAKYGVTGGDGANPPPAPTTSSLITCESCHNVQYNYGNYWLSLAARTPAQTLQAGYQTNLLLGLYEDDYPVARQGVENQNSAAATVDFDGAATDSEFCNKCHPFDAINLPHVHGEKNGWADWGGSLEVQRNVTNWATADVDPAAATPPEDLRVYPLNPTFPGNLSWRDGAANWTKFDCDACHRPHNAATTSIVPNDGPTRGGVPAPLITEIAGPVDAVAGSFTLGNPQYKTTMCENCHAPKAL